MSTSMDLGLLITFMAPWGLSGFITDIAFPHEFLNEIGHFLFCILRDISTDYLTFAEDVLDFVSAVGIGPQMI